jgi:predicted alpha/beta-hydrolase family hydrolase
VSVPLDSGDQTSAIRYAPTGTASKNVRIILAHGAGAGQRHPFIAGVARQLERAGVDVWTFDFPYMEQKRRAPDRAPVLEDCFRRVIGFALASAGTPDALFIGGKSMGGRIATHLAAQEHPMSGVFAIGYPLHPPGKPEQLRTAHLGAICVPVLIVQGERDAFGTPAELREAIGVMKARVTLEVIKGGDHSLATRGRASNQLYEWLATVITEWTRCITEGPRPQGSGPSAQH